MCKHCGKTTYLTHLHSCEIKPKEWRGLNDFERADIFYISTKGNNDMLEFAKAIEQKLKEKNT